MSPRSASSTVTLNSTMGFASPSSVAMSLTGNGNGNGSDNDGVMGDGQNHLQSLLQSGGSPQLMGGSIEEAFGGSSVLHDPVRDADPLAYITNVNPSKAVNVEELNTLLDSWGVSHCYELSHMEEEEIQAVAKMLKPIPRKVFLEKMRNL